MPIPVILDVDTGIDDSLAIALAVDSPLIDLVAVTTVAGNTTIDHATRNSLDVLALLNADDVPVYRGASRPLCRPPMTAPHVHGANGLGGAVLPRASRTEELVKGPARIVRLAQERPQELTVIAVGPLTNLAIALNVEPELPQLIKSVVIMGGAYKVPGNMSKAAEFNFFADPEAADQVFSAGFREVVALGLDVTHQAPIAKTWWDAAAGHRTPAQTLFHLTFNESFTVNTGRIHYMHDAMAVAAVIDRSLITTERHTVRIQSGDDERGASRLSQAASAEIATAVDAARFQAMMLRLFGLDG